MKNCLQGCFTLVTVAFILSLTLLSYLQTPFRGTIFLTSIKGNATIRFDEKYSIPYITGTTREAVVFAMGYVHAMDRLYDLSMKRAFAYGTLASISGEIAVPADKFMRSLSLEKAVDRDLKLISAEDMELLQAYANGVNAYVEESTMLPPEFQILGIDFERWTPKDSLMTNKFLMFALSCGWPAIALRSGVAEIYGKELADRLVPFEEKNSFLKQVTVVQEEDLERMGLLGKSKANLQNEKAMKDALKMEANPNKATLNNTGKQGVDVPKHVKDISNKTGEKAVITSTLGSNKTAEAPNKESRQNRKRPNGAAGSNAWVVGGKYTQSGYPIISSDPHFNHKNPNMFYLASFKFPDGPNVFGGMHIGLPWITIGRNDFVAWAQTVSYLETIDLLSINHNTTHYFYNNTWLPLTVHKHLIKVNKGQAVPYESYETHHGPIMYQPESGEGEAIFIVANTGFINKPLAVSWAGLKEPDNAMEAWRLINYASNTQDFTGAAKKFVGMDLTFLFATVATSNG
eukprot:TRINITY_DN5368_c0_g1_i9.p1 TRINITY_DN5368_c0_g1~~TRINITY_DN5368_c0_g1_i9.p1  ORF type:complete len:516 (+),score=126.56 TRINITY_DN5368_c0_g1_i9:205-1752(+)